MAPAHRRGHGLTLRPPPTVVDITIIYLMNSTKFLTLASYKVFQDSALSPQAPLSLQAPGKAAGLLLSLPHTQATTALHGSRQRQNKACGVTRGSLERIVPDDTARAPPTTD
uniref:Uncharacterized protein n=1 Tax=Leersia perrieri TaxID=77586 RepID=A0A0D9V8U4_9ORYZ